MLEDPQRTRFQAQLRALIGRVDPDDLPLPRKVEIWLTGADPLHVVVDTQAGELEPRGSMAPPLSVRMPRAVFEHLADRGPHAWLEAWDKDVIALVGDPVKIEMVEVYIERVLRPLVEAG